MLYTSELCKARAVALARLPAENVLAQPTRARLFEVLRDLGREAGTKELAQLVGLHVNGVRRQLERLEQAGLLERHRRQQGRGRPRDHWSVAAGADPDGESPQAYPDLAGWLAVAVPRGENALRQIEQTGREIGRSLAAEADEPAAQAFEHVLSALGFQPEIEFRPEGDLHCSLGNCPYAETARARPDVVCTLHKGITTGLLDELAPSATLSTFEPHDPEQAGCLVGVTGTGWSDPAEDGA